VHLGSLKQAIMLRLYHSRSQELYVGGEIRVHAAEGE
jgi:hypothetical protein